MSARRNAPLISVALTLAPLLFGLSVARPTSVAADCQGPLPLFRDFARLATTVVIADVTAAVPGGPWDALTDGRSSRLTIEVVRVLRGNPPPSMTVTDLPTWTCGGEGIVAHVGDRIALALDASEPGEPTISVNTEAWIAGTPPPRWSYLDTLTVAEVYRAIDQRPPDTSTLEMRQTTTQAVPVVLFVTVVTLLVLTLAGRGATNASR